MEPELASAVPDSAPARSAAEIIEREAYHAQIVSAAGAVEEQRMAAADLLTDTPERLRGWRSAAAGMDLAPISTPT